MTNPMQPNRVPRPVPAPSVPADLLKSQGGMPLQSGQAYVTDYVHQQLAQVGWEAGDPIPPDLGEQLKRIQAEVRAEDSTELKDTELAKNWKPVSAKFVDIASLPRERQEEIRSYLQDYKQEAAQQRIQKEQLAAAHAAIPDTVQGDQREVMLQQILAGREAESAREARKREAAGQSYAVDDREALSQPVTQPVPQPAAQPASQTAGQEAPPSDYAATLPPQAHNCNRCGWPQDAPYETQPTRQDVMAYTASMLAGGKFEKVYTLLGGRLVVVFQDTTVDEQELVDRQLAAMVRNQEITSDAEYWARQNEFTMALAVKRIEADGKTSYLRPEWGELSPPATMTATPLPQLLEVYHQHGAKHSTVRRLLFQQRDKFIKVVAKLEILAGDENFLSEIEKLE